MTVAGEPVDVGEAPELLHSFDNPDRPTELTIYDDTEDSFLSCRWITVDIAHAIVLDEMV